jgi:5-methylthioadenosine/S-adenosylhomocysteine deaminase
MFEMMRLAVLLAKVSTLDAQALQPSAVLEMALAGNALAVGAQADLVLVDLNAAHIQPLSVSAGAGNLLSALVHNVRSSDVDTLIVAGRVLIQNKTLLGLDEAALLEECRARAAALAAKCNVPMTSGQ